MFKNIKINHNVEYYIEPAVSNSTLGKINYQQGGSPAFFKHKKDKLFTDSLEIGTQVHLALLEPEKFKLFNIEKPSGKLGEVADKVLALGSVTDENILKAYERMSAYANYTDGAKLTTFKRYGGEDYVNRMLDKDPDVCYLAEPLYNKVMSSVEAIKQSRYADLFSHQLGLAEVPMFGKFTVEYYNNEMLGIQTTEVPIKIKADYIINFDDTITLIDLKTSSSNPITFMGSWKLGNKNWEFVQGSFQKYHYFRQLAFYSDCISAYFNKPIDNKIFVIQTEGVNEVGLIDIDSDWIEIGRAEYKRLLSLYAYCDLNNDWSLNRIENVRHLLGPAKNN